MLRLPQKMAQLPEFCRSDLEELGLGFVHISIDHLYSQQLSYSRLKKKIVIWVLTLPCDPPENGNNSQPPPP